MQAACTLALTLQLVSCVRVFELQSSILLPPRNDTYVQYHIPPLEGPDGERLEELATYTVCYRFQNTVLAQFETHWSYATNRSPNTMLMGRDEEVVELLLDGTFYKTNGSFPEVTMHKWVHWCWLHQIDTTILYEDGKQLMKFEGQPLSLLLNGTLVIGQEQDEDGGGFITSEIFRGYFTQGNMWSYLLDEVSILKMSRCEVDLRGNVFSTDNSIPYVVNAIVSNVDLDDLCQNREKSFSVSSSLSFDDATYICHSLGSAIFAPQNEAENEVLQEHTLQFANFCPGSFWLGIMNQEETGIWKGFVNDSVLPTYFDFNQTDPSRRCAVMTPNKGRWLSEHCDRGSTRCFDCFLTNKGSLSLKGLCFSSYMKSLFDVRGYINEKPYFHGLYGYIIFQTSNGDWNLVDTTRNKTLATLDSLHETGYPAGRTTWKLRAAICRYSRGHEIQLALSKCKEQEYMCSDGSCINSTLRCNAFAECKDQSDEDDCSIVHIPNSYLAHIAPTVGKSSDLLRHVSLNVSFTIQRFRNIIDAKHSIEMEFILVITWRDPRLTFYNLRSNSKDNELSDHETSRIWKPSIFFDNTLDGGVRVLKTSVGVNRESPSLPSDFNSANMETQYNGSRALLVLSQRLSGTFFCRFDVFKYPMDKQNCSLVLSLSTVRLRNISVDYAGPYTLHEFSVTDFGISKNYIDQRAIIQVDFSLHRLSNFIMFSVLLPSTLLQIIGYSTLYIKPNLLQVRLTITLTTLLVLYTLFSQTSSALPKTSYIKMIDVWFFFCISVLFVIIILHVVVDRLDSKSIHSAGPAPNQVAPATPSPLKFSPIKTQSVNKFVHSIERLIDVPTHPPERLLFMARSCLFPLVFIPVTITFWAIMKWHN